MRSVRVLSVALGLAACAAACGGDDKGGTSADTATATDTATALPDGVVTFDTAVAVDTAQPTDSATEPDIVVPGGFAAACQSNVDCDSGWCVEGPDGYICTKECVETCPEDYDCRSVTSVKGDIVFLCLPKLRKVCVPCLQDFQCNGGACLQIDGEGMCATGCDSSEHCPRGYECADDPTGSHEGTFCQPKSGSCSCSPTYEGVGRACTKTNDVGTCLGSETCDPEQGWVGCSARDAARETCNYADDDCDGEVDEDFRTDGVYASKTACGSCTTNCDEALPNTSETRCVVSDGSARCEVVSCAPGFSLLNPYVCAPDAGSTCQPCESAAQCVGAGAACVELTDGKFCTTACSEGSDCGDGFSCKQVPESAQRQCVPDSGSCTCDGSNTDLSRACSVTYTPPDPDQPSVTCKGLEQCTTSGWGGCTLPPEACDGIDNDCDGVVDQPFKTGDKYTAVDHCGACEVSCTALSGPNAEPTCDSSGPVPTCGFRCVGAAVDVNGIANDGCECVPIDGPDFAGDSLDSNCDGIDGEVTNGIFVSKSGDEGNPGTRELPVRTIATAITKAKAQTKRDVYVATGVYSENVILSEGIGVFGGYAPFFDEHDTTLYETAVVGQAPDATHPGTVTAIGLGTNAGASETVFDGFTIFGINAANLEAQNSYGVYVKDSGQRLRISRNHVIAGAGGNGRAGNRGLDGNAGVDGGNGANAKNLSSNCGTANESPGGTGGVRSCGATDVGGGSGGRAACPVFEVSPPAAAKGSNGKGTTAGTGGAFGWPMYICATTDPVFGSGCDIAYYGCGTCYLPQDDKPFSAGGGTNGTGGGNGAAGSGCTAGNATVTAGHWSGGAGGTGGAGTAGAGGGGGGSGAGVEVDGTDCSAEGNDDVGGSGGGGGSGGCGSTGGSGGTSGGGSFGVFVVGATLPKLSGNTIGGGAGGAGGAGGPAGIAGRGGRGGLGGQPGDALGNSSAKCAEGGGGGGQGGDGGQGGGGGGGCGGASYAVFYSGAAVAPAAWKTDNALTAGSGGAAGRGGASLVSASSGRDGTGGGASPVSPGSGRDGTVGTAAAANF